MKTYVVIEESENYATICIGVFSSRELADKAIQKRIKARDLMREIDIIHQNECMIHYKWYGVEYTISSIERTLDTQLYLK